MPSPRIEREPDTGASVCRQCRAPVFWAVTNVNGRRICLEQQADLTGYYEIYRETLQGEQEGPWRARRIPWEGQGAPRPLHKVHWDNCPRRKKAVR